MKRGRLPLTALRSFEVAGRLGSFTLAAGELFVSQAAISRQIRDLETTLGSPLFARRHRGVDLTPAGARLLEVLTRSFDDIESCLSGIAARPAAAEVRVSVEPSFAACWLVERLPDFQRLHPEIDLSIESDARLVEFRSGEAELAIRHSVRRKTWPRSESRHLVDTDMVAVMATAVRDAAGPIRQLGDLKAHVLLHETNRDVWRGWFEAMGEEAAETARGPVYADSGLVLQAVLRGQGVALLDRIFVAGEMRAGRVAQLFDRPVASGAYWLVARRFDRLSPAATRFVDWILARMRDEA